MRRAALLLALGVSFGPALAHAHPFGASSVNRYLGLEVQGDRALHLAWVLDFAELPSLEQLDRLDADHDGSVTVAEQSGYLDALVAGAMAGFSLTLNGVPTVPTVAARAVEVPVSAEGRPTVRVLLELRAPLPAGASSVTVAVREPYLRERSGWRELRAESSAFGTVESGGTPPLPRWREGSPLPARMPRMDEATVRYRVGPARALVAAQSANPLRWAWRLLGAAGVVLVASALWRARRAASKP